MVIVIDNYDSFVHNLARYVRQLGYKTRVIRHDKISIAEITQLNPSHIILSPGPCTPNEAGITLDVIHHFHQSKPILGVCLGHQAIAQYFQGKIQRALKPTHGKSTLVCHEGTGIFKGIHSPLNVGRYHSLIVNPELLTPEINITAYSPEGEVMALEHKKYPVYGLQFHPESILTEQGYELLSNFLNSPNT